MPNPPRQNYLSRLQRAIALLETAIDRDEDLPDLAAMAAAASFSPFHFHRLYRALIGEPVGRSVLRLRLLRAVRLLSAPDARVSDVALAVGYETSQALARSVRDMLDCTPSQLQADAALRDKAIALLATGPLAEPASAPLRVEVVSVEPFRVAVLRNVGEFDDLDQAYGRLFGWAGGRGLLDHLQGLFGRPAMDRRDAAPSEYAFDCMIAIAIPFDPDPAHDISVTQLGGGRFARVRHVGSYAELDALADRLYAEWLPTSGLELRDAALHHEYLDDPEHTPEAVLRSDLYLPLHWSSHCSW